MAPALFFFLTMAGRARAHTHTHTHTHRGKKLEWEELNMSDEDLGSGASGVVRKATVRDTGQVVALKVRRQFGCLSLYA